AGAPADERSVCEPPGGNGEDLRSTRSLRHPTRRCRTPGARVDPPRAGEWRGRRPTTTIRCRRFRPRENGRRQGKGHGVSVEGPGTPEAKIAAEAAAMAKREEALDGQGTTLE